MAEESFQERTEEATPRRREEARKKGQVAKSRELASVAVLLAGVLTLSWGASFFYRKLAEIFHFYFQNAASLPVDTADIRPLALMVLRQTGVVMAPLLAVMVAVAVLANLLQVGPLMAPEQIRPKWSNISPLSGLKRLFSAQAFMEFFKSLFKLGVVTWISYATVKGEISHLLPLIDQSPGRILSYVSGVSFTIFFRSALAMVILAVLDFLFQRWQHEKELRMTKQEVKEEFKQTEGDPQVKARIRSLQREAARKRMMAEVPEADVVITNPTHLAVALKYDPPAMEAPVVVAKGAGFVAEKIKEIAREHRVPVVENRELARSLYKSVEIGQAIPEALYRAVAEVLAFVYRMKGKV